MARAAGSGHARTMLIPSKERKIPTAATNFSFLSQGARRAMIRNSAAPPPAESRNAHYPTLPRPTKWSLCGLIVCRCQDVCVCPTWEEYESIRQRLASVAPCLILSSTHVLKSPLSLLSLSILLPYIATIPCCFSPAERTLLAMGRSPFVPFSAQVRRQPPRLAVQSHP
jgi:hypothetical protein